MWVGFSIARFVREPLVPVFSCLKVDTLQEKAGMQVSRYRLVPQYTGSLIIIIISIMVAKFSGNTVESLIAFAGFDTKLKEHRCFLYCGKFQCTASFRPTNIVNAIIGYMPYMLASALVLLVCYMCDGLANKALMKGNHTVLAMVGRIAIYTFSIFMVLSELGIAKEIVNTAFFINSRLEPIAPSELP